MKNLVIVESPSKSKTIEKYLGKDFKVVSSKGHIRDLSTHGKGGLGVDIEHNFKPDYIVDSKKKDIVDSLKKEASNSDFVYLATDPDREGEAISWHLAKELGLDLNDKNRIVFNEITKKAVLAALENPRSIDMDLVHSQETRRILDRIIGFKLSNLVQTKIKSQSAGRVQSVALRMICDREKEIQAFIPEEYWSIDAELEKSKKFKAALTKKSGKKIEIHNEQEANDIIAELVNEYIVKDITSKKKKREAYLPFTTSTMQQEASSKLNFSSKKTMNIAQGLYEGVEIAGESQGLITYMRSDSTRLSDDFINNAFEKIENEYGKEYKGTYRIKNTDNSQDAHEAIRPTSLANTPEYVEQYLTRDQYKLYKLIYSRALASLMTPAIFNSQTIIINNGDYEFELTGSTLEFDGYLKVYGDYSNNKDVILPKLNKDDVLKLIKLIPEQHFTEGPSRYTEAKLIKALEEEGVGRPSTYATIIDTNIQRNYVELKTASDTGKTKYFFPTEQGILTDEKLKEFFGDIINVTYTAKMEEDLDQVAHSNTDYIKILDDFYKEFEPRLNEAREKMEKVRIAPKQTGEKCPDCGSDLVYRKGPYGEFVACSNFPKCKYTKPNTLGRSCPKCGHELVKRISKKTRRSFIGCSNWPECDYVEYFNKKKNNDTQENKDSGEE